MINMSQVQYPSDFVGADGKLYPTVGEALFNIGYSTSSKKLYINIDGSGIIGTHKIMAVIAK